MKAKEKFLEYVNNKYGLDAPNICADYVNNKNVTPIWGYLLEFFDSEGVYIRSKINTEGFEELRIDTRNSYHVYFYENLSEAQAEAVKKAFEILEERI